MTKSKIQIYLFWLAASFFFISSGCMPKPIPKKMGSPEWGVQITWYGHSCFTLQDSLGRTMAIDPFDDTIGYAQLFLRADALLITHDHFDHNNQKSVKARIRNIDLVESTGTTPVASEVLVTGMNSDHDSMGGNIHGHNRIYTFSMGGLRIAHLGDFGQEDLTAEQKTFLTGIDVLFIPVGGVTTIDALKAKKIVDEIHPGAVFPMHYGDIRFYKLADVKDFTKLFSPDQLKNVDGNHLRIKKSELTDKPVIYTLHVPIQNN